MGLDLGLRISQIHSEEVSGSLAFRAHVSHHRAFGAGLKPRVSTVCLLNFSKNRIHAFKFFKKSRGQTVDTLSLRPPTKAR